MFTSDAGCFCVEQTCNFDKSNNRQSGEIKIKLPLWMNLFLQFYK